MSYANRRPKYKKGQVKEVFDNTHARQAADPPAPDLPPLRENQIYVQDIEGDWSKVTWRPGDARRGIWDMRHLSDRKYSVLHDDYMNGRISREEFLDEYTTADNYFAEGSMRNQSHIDEYLHPRTSLKGSH